MNDAGRRLLVVTSIQKLINNFSTKTTKTEGARPPVAMVTGRTLKPSSVCSVKNSAGKPGGSGSRGELKREINKLDLNSSHCHCEKYE